MIKKEKPIIEQEKDYLSERIDLMMIDLNNLKIKADHLLKKATQEAV